ncbi:unnamed protein product, partial [Polarella glacialis]
MGRHGLRCRHFMEAVVRRASFLVSEFGVEDLMRVWQGFIRFSRDNRAFYHSAMPKVRMQVKNLTVPQLILALRGARDLQQSQGFIDLHAAACAELTLKIDKLSMAQAANCLCHTGFNTKFRTQAQGLVKAVEQTWSETEDLTSLRVVEVVDTLETFTSWGMKPFPLLARLDGLLVDRQVELKYTGNVSLWVLATQAFSNIEYLDARWPLVALELSRDKLFLEKISFFQQCALIISLAKLRLFDEAAYRNIAELLLSDMGLFKDMQDLAPVLAAYASVGYFHQQLFGTAYGRMIDWFEAETLDMKRRDTHGALVQAAWSFALAGYHRHFESFAAVLDYAFFENSVNMRPATLKRVAQLADIVLQEAPELAAACHYSEKVSSTRADPRVRNLLASEPVSDPKLLQDIRTTLQELSWQHETCAFETGSTSAFYVDLSLAPQLGQKVGFMTAGYLDSVRVGLPDEGLEMREGGTLAVARRVLASHGWHTAVVAKD